MIVGIDGSNVGSGGSKTYFHKLLDEADPERFGISSVVVWGDRATLDLAPSRPWLRLVHEPALEGSLSARLLWQRRQLGERARAGCDLLFAPGGLVTARFRPNVTMSRNMLPFDRSEMRRYGLSPMRMRLLLLRFGQGRSLHRADGAVFLTEHARLVIGGRVRPRGEVAVVPHGVDERFRCAPRPQVPIERYSEDHPFRILYISTIDVYKHPWHLAEAVAQLRRRGLPVELDLVGGAYPPALRRLRAVLDRLDPQARFLRYRGAAPFAELPGIHREAQLFAFPSSCENMPNVLVEAMAAGHPIACSHSSPMPEILGDAGVYFDAEHPDEIAAALRRLVESPGLRERLAREAHARAAQYSWRRCAEETFAFVARVGRRWGKFATSDCG